jgi:carbon-monoxide dehydrogenase large subunit
VKWVEDRIENISTTAFARDYHMDGELAATADGKILGLRVNVIADHGAFDACADPTKYPAGMFHICSGSYDIGAAHCSVKGVYTNKAPGGVAYRCSFRVTEAVYVIERMVDVLAQKLGMDKAEIREKNFIRKEQFPYTSAFGFEYDSGDYSTALK